MKEAITTSTIMTVVLTTLTTPRTTTSTTNTEKTKPTKNIDVVTEEYSKKNIKGSHHFERYFEKNRTTEGEIIMFPVTVPKKKTEDFSTTKKIVHYTETTEEDIDLTVLPYDIITDNIIDNDTTSILPNGPIVSNITLKYNVKTVDIIENVTSSVESVESTTDTYYNTEKSKIDTAIDNITTPTLSSSFNDSEGYAAENFTNKYERLKAAVVTDITTQNLPTDPENNTNVKYLSDLYNYTEELKFDVTTNDIITSTSPTQSNPEEDRNTKYSTTYLNYKESTTGLEYSPTLINENVTSSSATMNYTPAIDERFSQITKIRNVM